MRNNNSVLESEKLCMIQLDRIIRFFPYKHFSQEKLRARPSKCLFYIYQFDERKALCRAPPLFIKICCLLLSGFLRRILERILQLISTDFCV